MSEKNLPPSEQKLREARENGQIARSRWLASAGASLGAMAMLLVGKPFIGQQMVQLTRSCLSLTRTPQQAMVEAITALGTTALIVLAGALMGAAASGVLMAGLHISAKAIAPNFEKLNVVEGLKKLFSGRSVVDMAKSLAGVGVLAWVALSELRDRSAQVLNAPGHGSSPFEGFSAVAMKFAAVVAVMGLFDWAHARFRLRKDLMMSVEDMKQEHKSSEGDPQAKHERKALAKKLAQQGPARGVAQATAVVVNPTHIAVAVRYDETEGDAPYIVARGREDDAAAIRAEANRLNVPIVRDVPLARSLIHFDVGEEVPEELYQAAAAVLKVALVARDATDASVQEERS